MNGIPDSFGTDRFSVGNELYYEARLEGKVTHRSPVTTSAVWRSGALNEGHYLLHVQGRDSTGSGAWNIGLLSPSTRRGIGRSGWRWFGIVGHSCFLSLHPLADVADEAAGTGNGVDSRPAHPGTKAQ